MENIVNTLLAVIGGFGYLGVFVLMTIESSFIPLPSEIIVPPAAYLAATGQMNIFLVILFGVLGSMAGATVNYWLARYLGRLLVYELVEKKWARFFLLTKKNVEHAEKYFLNYGEVSTFLGRLVPGIRHLISLPAGFVKMNYWSFLFYTFLGSTIWVSILAVLGYYFGANQNVLKQYYGEITLAVILFVLIALLIIYILKKKKKLTE